MEILDIKSKNYIKKGFIASFLMISNSIFTQSMYMKSDAQALFADFAEIGKDMRIATDDELRNIRGLQ